MDIFFLSYMETNADRNWEKLKSRFPETQRLHGINGVKNAHRKIAEAASSPYFFVVDGDNDVHEDFKFLAPETLQREALYVWRALNPVNDLCYGFGGIKLYNKWLLLENQHPTSIDVATTISPIYIPVPIVASTTRFNCSALESWRGAFRESAKLTLNILRRPSDGASASRLHVWRTKGSGQSFGKECILGANMGHHYALKHSDDKEALERINDFAGLNELYRQTIANLTE